MKPSGCIASELPDSPCTMAMMGTAGAVGRPAKGCSVVNALIMIQAGAVMGSRVLFLFAQNTASFGLVSSGHQALCPLLIDLAVCLPFDVGVFRFVLHYAVSHLDLHPAWWHRLQQSFLYFRMNMHTAKTFLQLWIAKNTFTPKISGSYRHLQDDNDNLILKRNVWICISYVLWLEN